MKSGIPYKDAQAWCRQLDDRHNRGAGPMRRECSQCGADGPFDDAEFEASGGLCGNCLWGDQPKPLDYGDEKEGDQ